MNEFEHRVAEQEWVLAVVKSPRHFIKIGGKMFCGGSMPRSHDAGLEQTEADSTVFVWTSPRTYTRAVVQPLFHPSGV